MNDSYQEVVTASLDREATGPGTGASLKLRGKSRVNGVVPHVVDSYSSTA